MTDQILGPPLTTCGCCGEPIPTAAIFNRPGLTALAYRAGTHATFIRRMLAALPEQALQDDPHVRPLAALTTRASDDPAIALLDAWAVVGDVLTFYQERIANEGFLRTATERRSVLELARTIGYELRPGVAATAYLAFTVDGSAGSPPRAVVPTGTKVQSLPAQRQLPQTFETSTALTARAAWNTLRPRATHPQDLNPDAAIVYLRGKVSDIKVGSPVLFITGPDPVDPSQVVATQKRVTRVLFEEPLQRTRIDLVFQKAELPPVTYPPLKLAVATIMAVPLTATTVDSLVLQQDWREADLSAFVDIQGWDEDAVVKHVTDGREPPGFRAKQAGWHGGTAGDGGSRFAREMGARKAEAGAGADGPPSASLPDLEYGLYRFAIETGPFGSTAPPYRSVSRDPRTNNVIWPNDWDDSFPITKTSGTVPTPATTTGSTTGPTTNWPDGIHFLFDHIVPEVQLGSWLILEAAAQASPYRVSARLDRAVADFGMSGKATGVSVQKPDGTSVGADLDAFMVRKTTIHAGSQKLELAELPIVDPIGKGTPEESQVTLDSMVVGLQVGQPVIITGERDDLRGVTVSEVAFLSDIIHRKGFTTLYFDPLQFAYVRSSVSINANVVGATHGETVNEVLGGGDGSQANQRFVLKKPPLTYVPASVPSGAQSTLKVLVNGVSWDEAPSLFDLDHRAQPYIVRIDNDSKASVIFGDGKRGARPPTGTENLTARYRSGIGSSGLVPAASLTLLQTRPLGVRGVTNPVAASGADDPEHLESARTNAPTTVLTLDRVVSLEDFENFARAFAGIGKAQAVPLWLGETHLVHLTVAGAKGAQVDKTSSVYGNLVQAIKASSDPVQAFRVDPHQALFFNVTAQVVVDPHYDPSTVLTTVKSALMESFSFAKREFGQAVTAAAVVSTIQGMAGVVATDLTQLYRVDDAQGPQQTAPQAVLPAQSARLERGSILPGQILVVNPVGISIAKMQAPA